MMSTAVLRDDGHTCAAALGKKIKRKRSTKNNLEHEIPQDPVSTIAPFSHGMEPQTLNPSTLNPEP